MANGARLLRAPTSARSARHVSLLSGDVEAACRSSRSASHGAGIRMSRRFLAATVGFVLLASALIAVGTEAGPSTTAQAATTITGPLHTNGIDGSSTTRPTSPCVSSGTTGPAWRTVAVTTFRRLQTCAASRGARLPTAGGQTFNYDDLYQIIATGDTTSFVCRSRGTTSSLSRLRGTLSVGQLRPQLEPDLPQRSEVDGHEGARCRDHGDPRHAPGLLVAGAAQHHQLGRHAGLLRGRRHAEVDESVDRCQGRRTTQNTDFYNGMNWFSGTSTTRWRP